ncbi:calcium uniporter protein, mitochondrial isoform X1 [Bacillus rossius redtenbacheri]|uniref:calcium uniporter protein, mitochondrial isoform X1 n=1 Tax=Bacillus rossius redtenbacheri TaxID=93214 RepID=UPI002FDD39F7
MAVRGTICRMKVILVYDLSRAFTLPCVVGAGSSNKGSWAGRPHHNRQLCTGRCHSTFSRHLHHATQQSTASAALSTAAKDAIKDANHQVTVEYFRGLPQVTVPLPSRKERCKFTLRPISNTVGDFLNMLRLEDRGIDRVIINTPDGVRIASSNTIEALMEDDFILVVNDNKYLVKAPEQERLSKKELERLSDVRNLVNQLYEALNVEEHQLKKERQLSKQLEGLKLELKPLEEKRNELDSMANRRTNMLTWLGLGLMSVQFGILARLTWWEYSWDIMEPITYFVTYGTAMAAYSYYVLTKQEYILPDVKDRQHLIIFHRRARKLGLDLQRYNDLKDNISKIEADLQRLRDPLHMHLPVHQNFLNSSDEPKSAFQRAQEQLRLLVNKTK